MHPDCATDDDDGVICLMCQTDELPSHGHVDVAGESISLIPSRQKSSKKSVPSHKHAMDEGDDVSDEEEFLDVLQSQTSISVEEASIRPKPAARRESHTAGPNHRPQGITGEQSDDEDDIDDEDIVSDGAEDGEEPGTGSGIQPVKRKRQKNVLIDDSDWIDYQHRLCRWRTWLKEKYPFLASADDNSDDEEIDATAVEPSGDAYEAKDGA